MTKLQITTNLELKNNYNREHKKTDWRLKSEATFRLLILVSDINTYCNTSKDFIFIAMAKLSQSDSNSRIRAMSKT